MKIAIMQPYFFPYIGYFSLIKNTEQFILLDDVQFIRHGWIERNRILKQNGKWLYVKVPILKDGQKTLIKNVLIDNQKNWKQTILSQLEIYKKKSPYYYTIKNLIEEVLNNDFTDIVSLNLNSLKVICDYLNIDSNFKIYSHLNLNIKQPTAPDEWALNICNALQNVTEYWNPIGGIDFFDKSKYQKSNIQLLFQKVKLEEYNQKNESFIPGLSIIDVLMFNPIDKIHEMLDNFELL